MTTKKPVNRIVYKVVRKIGNSYYSAVIITPSVRIKYELGKEIFPKVGKIIAFNNSTSAYSFVSARAGSAFDERCRILRCKAKNIKPVCFLWYTTDSLSKETANDFWNKFLHIRIQNRIIRQKVATAMSNLRYGRPYNIMIAPSNSVYVDSLTPIEILPEYPP